MDSTDIAAYSFVAILFAGLIAWNVIDPKSNALWRGKITWSEYMGEIAPEPSKPPCP